MEQPKSSPVSTRGSYLDTVLGEPVPSTFTSRLAASAESFSPEPKGLAKEWADFAKEMSTWNTPAHVPVFSGAFCIDCNNCGKTIPNEHYHCNICDQGDYDLCLKCIDEGVLCPGEDHWLIKRTINNGVVTNSTTETIAPRKQSEPEPETHDEATPETEPVPVPVPEPEAEEKQPKIAVRTCNACFEGMFNQQMSGTMLTCA